MSVRHTVVSLKLLSLVQILDWTVLISRLITLLVYGLVSDESTEKQQ